MAGLLEFLSSPEAANGLGLLAAAGPRFDGAGFGQRLQEGLAYGQAQRDAEMKRKQAAAAAEMQAMQMEQAKRKFEWQQKLMGDLAGPTAYSPQVTTSGQPPAMGQLGSGSFGIADSGNNPAIPSVIKQQQSRIASMTPDQIAAYKAITGEDLTPIWKIAKEGFERKPGSFYDDTNGRRSYVGDPTKGFALDDKGNVTEMPGYSRTQASIEGAKAAAIEGAKAGLDTVAVDLPDGTKRSMTRAQASEYFNQPENSPMNRGLDVSKLSPEQTKMLLNADPLAFSRGVQRAQFSNKQLGVTQSSEDATNQAVAREQALGQAKDIGEQRRIIMTGGFTAGTQIAKYKQLGQLLAGVDGGSLTATGTHIASAMNSLGFKIDKDLPNKEAAAALGNEMALELRSPANGAGMPGAMSDSDRQFLVSMIPNANQTAAGRKMLIDSAIAIHQRKQQVATFARNYEKKYGRLDNGFFEQMQAWSDSNPLFGGK